MQIDSLVTLPGVDTELMGDDVEWHNLRSKTRISAAQGCFLSLRGRL